VINPMIVEGQVHGGIAQGIGQALLEGAIYDKAGQLVTGSYMDYSMPHAHDLPSFHVGLTETKSPSNPLGIKGCGEAGAIAAPAAVINAITGTLADVLPPKLNYAAGARYFLSYPEDIKLYGLSFNTQLGSSGVALQGEVSYRQDVPLQVDDLELLYAALTPLRLVTIPAFARVRAVGAFLAANNQVGAYGFAEEIEGFRRFDTAQAQMTATKIFGPMIGADQAVLVWEGAVSHVYDLPEKSVLRLEGPGTYVSGNPVHQGAGIQPGTEPATAFADATAWGYVLAGRLDYNNAFANINLSPRFSWQHDVGGVSPGPGGNFIEGRTALTVGLSASYRISWEVDVSYTRFAGAGRYNLINDRDFIATSVKYTF